MGTIAAILRQQAQVILALADQLEAPVSEMAEYVTQHTSPLGKRRFLNAARRGEFPSTRKGKLVLATKSDLDAWLTR